MKRKIGIPLVIALLIGLDQWVKAAVVAHIPLGQVKDFVPGVVSLTYLQNTGAAFSMLENQQWFFALITVLVMGGAIWYLYKNINGKWSLLASLSLIIAGGIGNFIDRVSQGFVVDMFQLDFVNFAVFNVADSYLTVGVALLMLVMMREEENGS